MKKTILILLVFCSFNVVLAQKNKTCVNCNMYIKSNTHNAKAVTEKNTLEFDAIECLVDYIQEHNNKTFTSFWVSNYTTGNFIKAENATYIISKAMPSPMGANLSAFKSAEDAQKIKEKKGGNLYSWEELQSFLLKKNNALIHNNHNHHSALNYAPVGVMGDHLHQKGGLMVSARYMNMAMSGNKSGTSTVDNASIYNNYMVAPQKMNMQMGMLGIMYAPSNTVTLMAMQNYVANNMDLQAQMMMNGMTMNRDFSTSSNGLADLKLSGLIGVVNNNNRTFHVNTTLSIPVGSITKRDNTPMMQNAKLPYAMQLGSGTLDFTFGATYKENYTLFAWGSQLLSTIRTGENKEGYRLGNLHQLNIWGAYELASGIAFNLRVLGVLEDDISGADNDLNPMMVTTADTNNYGGEKIKSFIGFTFLFPQQSAFKDFRLSIEAGAPVYENYNGVQMNENLNVNFGLFYTIL